MRLFVCNFLLIFSHLYQIARLGEDDDQPEFSSRVPLEEGEIYFYDVHPLKNLVAVDEIDSLCPLIKSNVCWRRSAAIFLLMTSDV